MDDALRDLYQEVIVDHGRHPRNRGVLLNANAVHEGYNPLCGDQLTVYIREEAGRVLEIQFEGHGCAISMASASLMTEAVRGKTVVEVEALFHAFHDLVTEQGKPSEAALGKLVILKGVAEFPMRVKCATLCWHTIRAALRHDPAVVSTE